MAALDVLKKAAAKSDKKKSETPEVSIPVISEKLQTLLKAINSLKDAEAEIALIQEELRPIIDAERVKVSRTSGKFASSVKVNDSITYVVSNKYSAIPTEQESALKKLFNGKYSTYFTTKTTCSLSDKALADEAVLQSIIDAVGADKFAEYFVVKQSLVPTEAFHQALTLDESVANKAQALVDDSILKPAKPSYKVA